MSHQSTTRGSLNIWDEGVRKYVVADPRLHESSSSLDDISLDPFTSSGRSTARESPQPELAYPYVDAMPRSMNRLRLPLLGDTCERLLKSALPFVDPYHYNALKDELHAFQQGAGKELQRLLEAREAQQDQPSWLEQFCDDMYLENRDPLPINVNYFFGFKPHPVPAAMTQVGRAASLLHAALEVYVQIRDGTLTNDMERASPLCMSQMRRVFCASRVPGEPRDSIVSYSTAPLTADERRSDTSQYVAVSPSHCVVIVRNRFYRVRVLDDGGAVLPLERIGSAIARALASAKDAGPPVGLLTTLQRGEWAEAYKALAELGNGDLLLAMQSAIMVVCLDSAEAKTPAELAKMLLHGTGMNRWFDRHNLIVARNGAAGVNFEHSVGDALVTHYVAEAMIEREACAVSTPNVAPSNAWGAEDVSEMYWKVGSEDGPLLPSLHSACDAVKKAICSTETHVLRFASFGSALGVLNSHRDDARLAREADAFVQIALQLTYFRLYGRNCGTYDTASTHHFTYGRTETVRSATAEALAFCLSAMRAPVATSSRKPGQSELLLRAIDALVELTEAAMAGQGIDRHLLGLRKVAEEYNNVVGAEKDKIHLPEFMTDPTSAFSRSSRFTLTTAHCGSKSAPLFGFGPGVADGFGVGYKIFDKEIRFTVTSRYTREVPRCLIFCHVLQESLLLMRALLESTAPRTRESRQVRSFVSPTGFADVSESFLVREADLLANPNSSPTGCEAQRSEDEVELIDSCSSVTNEVIIVVEKRTQSAERNLASELRARLETVAAAERRAAAAEAARVTDRSAATATLEKAQTSHVEELAKLRVAHDAAERRTADAVAPLAIATARNAVDAPAQHLDRPVGYEGPNSVILCLDTVGGKDMNILQAVREVTQNQPPQSLRVVVAYVVANNVPLDVRQVPSVFAAVPLDRMAEDLTAIVKRALDSRCYEWPMEIVVGRARNDWTVDDLVNRIRDRLVYHEIQNSVEVSRGRFDGELFEVVQVTLTRRPA